MQHLLQIPFSINNFLSEVVIVKIVKQTSDSSMSFGGSSSNDKYDSLQNNFFFEVLHEIVALQIRFQVGDLSEQKSLRGLK